MLPKEYRLNLKRDKFPRRRGGEIYTPIFKIAYWPGDPSEAPKIGFIVSGQIGKATQRNSVRRRLSEAARERLKKFPAGTKILIIANKDAREKSYEEICTWLDRSLPKIDLASH